MVRQPCWLPGGVPPESLSQSWPWGFPQQSKQPPHIHVLIRTRTGWLASFSVSIHGFLFPLPPIFPFNYPVLPLGSLLQARVALVVVILARRCFFFSKLLDLGLELRWIGCYLLGPSPSLRYLESTPSPRTSNNRPRTEHFGAGTLSPGLTEHPSHT